MVLHYTPEKKQEGQSNFLKAVGQQGLGPNRRTFMKGLLAGTAVLPVTAAMYFGYQKIHGSPVKVGLIGAGDEGGVLVGEHNPDFLQFVAVADLRPSNQKRIFDGDPQGGIRKGFKKIYGADAEKKIKVYDDYKELLARPDIEAVVIALPLHLHAPVAIDALNAKKHVLCEKLMAWNITQCKEMIKAAEDNDRIISIGHQRHYSMLYAHAKEIIESGELGDIKHIRALWHRNNSWPKLDKDGKQLVVNDLPQFRDSWHPDIPSEDREKLEKNIRQLGYESMEELVRWRLFNRTGAGLMAELGSHQLDACSIFLGKVHPLAVSGVGGKLFYRDERESDDSVFVTFEFPGKNYFTDQTRKEIKDKNDIVVVTYSSINTNSFENYGECVMGSHGNLVVEKEESIMLFPERNPNAAAAGKATKVTVSAGGGGKQAVESSASTLPEQEETKGKESLGTGPISRGYREEMEHFAYCIKMWNEGNSKQDRPIPRCPGKVAMADAIIALTSNLAMKRHERIQFDEKWYDASLPDVPDAEMKPKVIS